jgi:predicted MFS family arabinose efflux permease
MEKTMNETKKNKSPGMILVTMLISMMAGAICMNKVAPVLINIQEDLGISSSAQAGLLMSIFTFSGIILSVPMGVLTTKYGTFKTGLLSLIAIIAGSVLGAMSNSYTLMLGSRLIEGIGLMFLGTIGPAAVARAFAGRNSGTAMGLLMCYMSFGQIVALNIAPIIAAGSTWRNFWWISAAFGAFALVLWLIIVRDEKSETQADTANTGENVTLGKVLSNKNVLLVCVAFFTYCVVHFGVFSYLPTYMTEIGGISATKAGSLTSIASLIGIPIGILGGVLADKWGSIKKPLALTMILLAVVVALTPMFGPKTYFVYVVLYGVVAMAQAGLSFAAVTTVVRPEETAIAAAALSTGQWLGAFLSTLVFGALLDAYGWTTTFYIMIPIAVVGILSIVFNKKLK